MNGKTRRETRRSGAPPWRSWNTRLMWFENEAALVRVHECMALTSANLLSSIVTAWPVGLSGLGAWLSMIAAVTRSRSATTSAWFIRSKPPSGSLSASPRIFR
jgi:hypothetical protein